MTEEQTNNTSNLAYADDVSPDSLMSDFRGRPIFAIVAFTVIVHVVVIGGFSVGYEKNVVLGEDTASVTEKERLDMAVRDATKSLREIAETYDVSPQELSDRFADGNTPTSGAESPNANDEAQEANSGDSVTASGTDEPNATNVDLQKPKSAIEDELQIEAAGPQVPKLPSIDDEEDLFK